MYNKVLNNTNKEKYQIGGARQRNSLWCYLLPEAGYLDIWTLEIVAQNREDSFRTTLSATKTVFYQEKPFILF